MLQMVTVLNFTVLRNVNMDFTVVDIENLSVITAQNRQKRLAGSSFGIIGLTLCPCPFQ